MRYLNRFIATIPLTLFFSAQLFAQSLNTVNINIIGPSGIPEKNWLIEPFSGNKFSGVSESTSAFGDAKLALANGKYNYKITKDGSAYFIDNVKNCSVKNCQSFTFVVPPDSVLRKTSSLLAPSGAFQPAGTFQTMSAMSSSEGALQLTIPNPSSSSVNLFGIGTAVTPSGDIIASALNWDPVLNGYNGRVYLIDGVTGMTLLDIPNPNPSGTNNFGWSVASASNGDIIVGDFTEDVGGVPAGAVYVFNGSTGVQLFKLNNPNPTSGDEFGYDVAGTSNGSIVVSASKEANGGAVYVYDAFGVLQDSIFNPTTDLDAGFGTAIATTTSGNIVIGAPFQDVFDGTSMQLGAGAAYLYTELNGTQLLAIDNPDPLTGDFYGFKVEAVNNDKIISASLLWDDIEIDSGKIYVHDALSGALLWGVPNPVADFEGWFGNTMSGTPQGHVAIGAARDDTGAVNSGRVFVFDGVSGDLIKILDNPVTWAGANFGQGLAVSGTGEFVVGAFVAHGGPGEVYTFSSVLTGDVLDLLNDLVFADGNLESCVLDQAATNSWAIADEVTVMNCSTLGIIDTSGIEELTSLTSLDLSDNKLADITGLDSLVNLVILDLSGNTAISCLDLDALETTLSSTTITRPAECAQKVQNLHNAMGQRAVKSVDEGTAGTLHFIYDQAGQVIAEIDAITGTTLREYIYVNGVQVALVDDTDTVSEETYFVHTDHLATPQKITDSTQSVVWSGSYEPFGKVEETVASIENNIRFPGQYEDSETELNYNYFRNYDPSLGRYVESDPIGLEGGMNIYSYVSSQPINYFDPLGLIACGYGDTTLSCSCKTRSKAAQQNCQAAGGIPMFPGMLSESTSDEEAKSREHGQLHSVCDSRPPSGLDACELAKFKLNKAKSCKTLREAFARKWFNGEYDSGHAERMRQLDREINTAKKAVQRQCQQC